MTQLQAFLQSSFCYKWIITGKTTHSKSVHKKFLKLKEAPVVILFWKILSSGQTICFSSLIVLINSKDQIKDKGKLDQK